MSRSDCRRRSLQGIPSSRRKLAAAVLSSQPQKQMAVENLLADRDPFPLPYVVRMDTGERIGRIALALQGDHLHANIRCPGCDSEGSVEFEFTDHQEMLMVCDGTGEEFRLSLEGVQ